VLDRRRIDIGCGGASRGRYWGMPHVADDGEMDRGRRGGGRRLLRTAAALAIVVLASGCGKTSGPATGGAAGPSSSITEPTATTAKPATSTTKSTLATTTSTAPSTTITRPAGGTVTLAQAAALANVICARYNALNKALPNPNFPSSPPYTQAQLNALAASVDSVVKLEVAETAALRALKVPAANAAALAAALDVQAQQARLAPRLAAELRAGNSTDALAGIQAFNDQSRRNDVRFDALGMHACGSDSEK